MSDTEKLLQEARKALTNAYTPYSNFPVGAAVETSDGQIFQGCNVSNSGSGLSMCAERTAIFNAVVHGHKDLVRLAVTVKNADPSIPESLMPCGACRQVMTEFMSPDAEIIIDGLGSRNLKELLPLPFKYVKKSR